MSWRSTVCFFPFSKKLYLLSIKCALETLGLFVVWHVFQGPIFVNGCSNKTISSSIVHRLHLQILLVVGVKKTVVITLKIIIDVVLIHINNQPRKNLVHIGHKMNIMVTIENVFGPQLVVLHALHLSSFVPDLREKSLHGMQRGIHVLLTVLINCGEATAVQKVHNIFWDGSLPYFCKIPDEQLDYTRNLFWYGSSSRLYLIIYSSFCERKHDYIDVRAPNSGRQALFPPQSSEMHFVAFGFFTFCSGLTSFRLLPCSWRIVAFILRISSFSSLETVEGRFLFLYSFKTASPASFRIFIFFLKFLLCFQQRLNSYWSHYGVFPVTSSKSYRR